MPKKILADMVPSRRPKKSISQEIKKEDAPIVTPAKTSEIKVKKAEVSAPPRKASSFLSDLPNIKHESRVYNYDDTIREADYSEKPVKSSKHSLWVVAFISIIFLFFAFSTFFAKAKVTVTPKMEEFTLNNNFSAFKDSNSDGVLPFSIVSLSAEESKTVTASEEKDSEQKATGKVVLYNNFSTTPQKLAKETRLIGTNNKIYKTEKEVTLPGLIKANPAKGIKENTPGSLEVDVFASESGEEYNTSPIDFKILGFKGSSKYELFYGRSKGDITGGLKGRFNFVSQEEKDKVEAELKEALEKKLLAKVTEEIPEGYVLFQNGTVFRIDDQDMDLVSKEKEVPFVLQGTLYGFLFEEKSITQKIVRSLVTDYDNSEVYIPNLNTVSFSASLPVGVTSYLNIKDLDFSLVGPVKIIWKVNENKLRESLLGKSKKDFNKVLENFVNIDKANLVLNPIWRTSIPSKLKDIKIIVNYE